jgi:hypothetical protein
MVAIFVSNGTLSCLPRFFFNFVPTFSIKTFDKVWQKCYFTSSVDISYFFYPKIMLNLRRESKGRIHSFKLSRESIKLGPFILWGSIVFEFEFEFRCKKSGITIGYSRIFINVILLRLSIFHISFIQRLTLRRILRTSDQINTS